MQGVGQPLVANRRLQGLAQRFAGVFRPPYLAAQVEHSAYRSAGQRAAGKHRAPVFGEQAHQARHGYLVGQRQPEQSAARGAGEQVEAARQRSARTGFQG